MAKKPSLGRQKIKIAKIEKNNHLQVTFSKRRFGLFKKASELVTLCGVEVCIIVSSPGGKVFSFGHPNIDFIANKFLNHPSASLNSDLHCFAEARCIDSLGKLGMQLEHILDEIEAEKKRGESLATIRKDSDKNCWWRAPIDNLGLFELEQLRSSMEELKNNATNEANNYLVKGLAAQADFSTSFYSFDEKIPCQNFDFSANSSLDYSGYGQGFF